MVRRLSAGLALPRLPDPCSLPHWSTDLSAANRFSPAGQDWIIGLLARALGGKGPRGEDYGDPRGALGLVESESRDIV